LRKPANYRGVLDSRAFAITDSNYGITGAIYQCPACGFLECPELPEVTGFYEQLEDEAYEAGRNPRSLQAKRILQQVTNYRRAGRLLDIGAGSGMLVEQALEMGYEAEGIEPSRWLQSRALERGLPVHLGTFPYPLCQGPYDVVTLIDVIEHVLRPLDLLRAIRSVLAPGGVLAVVTPDVRSLAARVLSWRWWHFRVAHVGYFDKPTLELAARRAGFALAAFRRSGWFFSGDYLWDRGWKLAGLRQRPAPRLLRRITVPINPRDSLLAILRPAKEPE
jgi:SAM-dependent methyltransferase